MTDEESQATETPTLTSHSSGILPGTDEECPVCLKPVQILVVCIHTGRLRQVSHSLQLKL